MKTDIKKRYHTDKEFKKRVHQYSYNWRKRNPIRFWANQSIQNHKQRRIIFITRKELEDWAIKTKECWICGEILEYSSSKNKGGFKHSSASVDIINREKPTTKDNLQIICNRCNICKGTSSIKDFIDYCKLITQRNKI